MTSCILHIGMMKTGTSSIQESLKGFSDERIVSYRDHKGRTNHTPAVFGLVGAVGPAKASRSSGREIAPEFEARHSFDEQLRSLAGRSLVVSGEGMRWLATRQIRDLLAYLQSLEIGKITVVAYVRPPVGFITSSARATKGGLLHNLNVAGMSVDYQEIFEKFDRALGRENVFLWKFDPQFFPSGCVVQDFCQRLGTNFPGERIVRVNESLSREAVALLYTYRRFGIDLGSRAMTKQQHNQLVQRLAGIGQTKFRFSPDLVRPFLENNRLDIEWMEARLGQSLHEDLGEHQPGDIREEWDLIRPDPDVVEKLRDLLGRAAPVGVRGETPEEVASLVHALRGESVLPSSSTALTGSRQRAAKISIRRRNRRLEGPDARDQIPLWDPKTLSGVTRDQAQELGTNVFRYMKEILAQNEDGFVTFAGLGQFRIRKAEKVEGEQGAARARIRFWPAIDGGGGR
jgi:hypothetical protein